MRKSLFPAAALIVFMTCSAVHALVEGPVMTADQALTLLNRATSASWKAG